MIFPKPYIMDPLNPILAVVVAVVVAVGIKTIG